MGAKKVRVEFVDGSGQGVGGVTVKATGCSELQTAPMGQAFFLVEDENFAVFANGAEVYKGTLSAMPEKIVFKQDGAASALADIDQSGGKPSIGSGIERAAPHQQSREPGRIEHGHERGRKGLRVGIGGSYQVKLGGHGFRVLDARRLYVWPFWRQRGGLPIGQALDRRKENARQPGAGAHTV